MAGLRIRLDRARRSPLAAQIYCAVREGIENGRLTSGARLPSWRDLAAQLGVSRGTVQVAYERLIAEQFRCLAEMASDSIKYKKPPVWRW